MRIDMMKATLGSAWLIAIGAIALSDVVTADSSRAILLGFGVVPVVIIWTFWAPPEPSLSPSVNRARQSSRIA
jgi:hypothetical protein